jgi:glutathione S-transferase
VEELTMNLYFAPLACSLATRIALYEAGADAQYTCVDMKTKRLADGSDFFDIAPMGQVVALRTDDGVLLTENAAVLQYVADRFPAAKLAPAAGLERARLQEWLGFIGTELQKAVFVPLLDPKAPEGAKLYAREKAALRLGVLERHLSAHEFLLDRFTVADAYLATVLNWAASSGVDLADWPAVSAYHQRMLKRPSVAKAVGEERAMYQEEQKSRAKS